MSDKIDCSLKKREEWVELFPYGVSVAADMSRPVMIFKDKDEKRVLPVWLSHLDAGIAVHQNGTDISHAESPFGLTWKVLKPLGIFLKKCLFTEVKGHHQYVELHFDGHPKLKTIRARADESVAFCLSTETKFYCKDDYFNQCRILDAEMSAAQEEVKIHPGLINNNHPYIN